MYFHMNIIIMNIHSTLALITKELTEKNFTHINKNMDVSCETETQHLTGSSYLHLPMSKQLIPQHLLQNYVNDIYSNPLNLILQPPP